MPRSPGVVRAISPAEAVVAQSLMAGAPEPPESRIPRRTAQAVRRRLFLREWLQLRYVPDLAAIGSSEVTFAVAQPFLESSREAVGRWRSCPEAVLLWASPELVFGVFATPPGPPSRALQEVLSEPDSQRSTFLLTVDARDSLVPIFFDFEGVWARTTGSGAVFRYPQPLPGIAGHRPNDILRTGERDAMLRLITRPFLPADSLAAARTGVGMFAAQWERRCLQSGRVARRVFLDPIAVGRWAAPFPRQLALVHGALREGENAEDLCANLLERCGLRPFLFATDRRNVLLGTLSSFDRPVSPPIGDAEIPVLRVLQRSLSGIVVLREPLGGLEVLINHRYDRPMLTHLRPSEETSRSPRR